MQNTFLPSCNVIRSISTYLSNKSFFPHLQTSRAFRFTWFPFNAIISTSWVMNRLPTRICACMKTAVSDTLSVCHNARCDAAVLRLHVTVSRRESIFSGQIFALKCPAQKLGCKESISSRLLSFSGLLAMQKRRQTLSTSRCFPHCAFLVNDDAMHEFVDQKMLIKGLRESSSE